MSNPMTPSTENAVTEDLARKPKWPAPKSHERTDVTIFEGFGKPWTVLPRAAYLWSRLDGGYNIGTARKGSIVGEQLRVPMEDGLRIRLSRACSELYETQWACPSHVKMGVIMKEAEVDEGLDLNTCVIAAPFKKIYRDVVDICYKRIYEDNLDTLWQGDQSRLPGKSILEAKLFRPASQVLHAVNAESEFVGGAIVHSFQVPCIWNKMCTVTYIDNLATVRGSHAGRALWMALSDIPTDIVALHSILLEEAIAFWTSCGFYRIDASNEKSLTSLKEELYTKSGAVCSLNLDDLLAALPRSDLPLFVCCLGRGASAATDPEEALLMPSMHGDAQE